MGSEIICLVRARLVCLLSIYGKEPQEPDLSQKRCVPIQSWRTIDKVIKVYEITLPTNLWSWQHAHWHVRHQDLPSNNKLHRQYCWYSSSTKIETWSTSSSESQRDTIGRILFKPVNMLRSSPNGNDVILSNSNILNQRKLFRWYRWDVAAVYTISILGWDSEMEITSSDGRS
jgi:hypothetical protein